MWDESGQQLVRELTVTQVQLFQPFRAVQHQGQSSTGPLIQCGVTEVQLSTQGSTQGHCSSHGVPLSVHRHQGHQLEEDSFTGSKQENQSKKQTVMLHKHENEQAFSLVQVILWSFSLEVDSVQGRKQQLQSAVLHLTVLQVELRVLAAVSQDGGDGPAVIINQPESPTLILLWQLHTGGAGQVQPVPHSPEQAGCCPLQGVRGSTAVDEPQQQIPVNTGRKRTKFNKSCNLIPSLISYRYDVQILSVTITESITLRAQVWEHSQHLHAF